MRTIWLCPLLLLTAQPCIAGDQPQGATTPVANAPEPPKEIAKDLASGDGMSRETAYVIPASSEVTGVPKEYMILRYLGLEPGTQSLVSDGGKTYDMVEATDPKTGQKRKVWFDISKFFGKL